MFRHLPPEPHVPESQRGAGPLSIRYEDVTQDGRLRLETISHAVGASLWRRTLLDHPLAKQLAGDGVLPILSRLRVEAAGGPISASVPVSCRGTFELLRTVDGEDRTRIRMDMWGEIVGTVGRTHGPPPENAGEPTPCGRMIAQHVLTRPFAATPEQRAVCEVPGGLPEGTTIRDVPWAAPWSVLDLPPTATPIDDAFSIDATTIVFGLAHTDSNQHVNSLVYPRLIEEAALRRFSQLGLPTTVLARFVDVAFRKPCFAGDRVRVMVRAYEDGDERGVVAAVIGAGEALGAGTTQPGERAHCYARMQLAA